MWVDRLSASTAVLVPASQKKGHAESQGANWFVVCVLLLFLVLALIKAGSRNSWLYCHCLLSVFRLNCSPSQCYFFSFFHMLQWSSETWGAAVRTGRDGRFHCNLPSVSAAPHQGLTSSVVFCAVLQKCPQSITVACFLVLMFMLKSDVWWKNRFCGFLIILLPSCGK